MDRRSIANLEVKQTYLPLMSLAGISYADIDKLYHIFFNLCERALNFALAINGFTKLSTFFIKLIGIPKRLVHFDCVNRDFPLGQACTAYWLPNHIFISITQRPVNSLHEPLANHKYWTFSHMIFLSDPDLLLPDWFPYLHIAIEQTSSEDPACTSKYDWWSG